MQTQQNKRSGFTLIEMLVVIAIIALLAAILVPTVTSALENANRTRVLSNGRGIHQSIFSAMTGDILYATESYWPASTTTRPASPHGTTSTQYFIHLMRGRGDTPAGPGVLNQDFGVFAATGVPPAQTLTGANSTVAFAWQNNCWSVTDGLTQESTSNTPLIFTRNLNVPTLLAANTGVITDQQIGTDPYAAPYANRAVVVIFNGGGGAAITGRALDWQNFNPANSLNNVMRPQ